MKHCEITPVLLPNYKRYEYCSLFSPPFFVKRTLERFFFSQGFGEFLSQRNGWLLAAIFPLCYRRNYRTFPSFFVRMEECSSVPFTLCTRKLLFFTSFRMLGCTAQESPDPRFFHLQSGHLQGIPNLEMGPSRLLFFFFFPFFFLQSRPPFPPFLSSHAKYLFFLSLTSRMIT